MIAFTIFLWRSAVGKDVCEDVRKLNNTTDRVKKFKSVIPKMIGVNICIVAWN